MSIHVLLQGRRRQKAGESEPVDAIDILTWLAVAAVLATIAVAIAYLRK
jgi:hypothetical protein